ncbi:hypothetical protein CVT26_006003 [Gymnopilus dilepis]|uniref:G-protein coupled receptors family 1 profile domain-containing protein n=1 Tax=Gymnopilus dilepis TaxID=231916 RepID=A0A409Y1B5_9AGAR|nr:hypothetical protein CVT26_006003 [Gymnopilus dilepis]
MPNISATDRVLALFLAALATGVYLVTLFYCLRWLLFTDDGWRLRKKVHKTMLGGTLAIFVLSSIHLSLAAEGTYVDVRDEERGIPMKSGGRLPWSSLVMCMVSNTSVLIADGFLIYRCWMVCLKSIRMIIVPCVFWIGGVVCTALQLYLQTVQTDGLDAWTPVNMSVGPGTILTPFWGTTIVVNIYATGIIGYKLWRRGKAQSKVDSKSSTGEIRVLKIMRIIIESGVIYLLITIPHFIVWFTTSNLAIVILGWINLPVVGSAFNLIIIRSAKHRVEEYEVTTGGRTVISTIKFSSSGSPSDSVIEAESRSTLYIGHV